MSSPIETFKDRESTSDLLYIVFYRGHWCPFCASWLKDLQSISDSIRAANGTPIAITSEVPEHINEMRTLTGFQGEIISDPSNEIAADLKSRYQLNVAISDKKGYAHGMAQPAVLVVKKDGTMLFKWAIVPGMMNLGGAKDRPSLAEIWEDAQQRLDGKEVKRHSYTKQSFFGVIGKKLMA